MGYFPSASFAWNLAEENFMKRFEFLSESKFRVSFGVTGNNRVDDYASFPGLEQGGQASYTPGGNFVSGATPTSLGNPDLKWESTKDFNIGLDMGLLNQRVTLTADVYKKTTTNLLLETMLPTSTGYVSASQNIGSVSNKGLELTLNTINLRKKNFSWSSSFNISFNRTEVLGLTQNQNDLLTGVRWNSGNAYAQNTAFIAHIGEPVAMFYGYKWIGNYQYSDFDEPTPGTYVLKADVPNNGTPRANVKPGDIKYSDLNNDKVVDAKDLGVIGNPNPKFIGGFSNNFTYKGFDLNVFFQFVYGNEIYNINRFVMEGVSNVTGANQFATVKNRWTPENQTNEMFRIGGSGPAVYSDRIVEDGSFLRLKTINLGYRFDPGFVKRIKLSGIRAYVSAQNLITWTNYSGNDPEVSVFNSALTPGMDYSAYPRAKVVTFGLDLTF
jgi:TonB-linked SusC/RagA family outer membrane protein